MIESLEKSLSLKHNIKKVQVNLSARELRKGDLRNVEKGIDEKRKIAKPRLSNSSAMSSRRTSSR